ncbi:MAG: hypothetical protein QOH58_1993 [Thermoleophilaceae bacterium]|nr:hypothetical protein [Thermoleophilaceae bacterium]
MSHRRDQKEALRRERELREQQARAAEQRKKMVGYGIAAAIAIAAVVVAIVLLTGGADKAGSGPGDAGNVFPDGGSFPKQTVFDLAPAAKAAGCELRSKKGSGVATHTTDLSDRVKYNTNPPTTGRHYEIPADDGIYGKAPQDEQLVHNMEHGRVIIWVKPSLPEEQRAALTALVKDDPYQMVLVPRRNMPYAVAATAWNADPPPGGTGRLLLCNEVNDKTFDALAAFRDEHRSQGPEPIP